MAAGPPSGAAEIRASLVLLAAAALALLAANSPASGIYKALLAVPVQVQVADFVLADPLKYWIKNLLMAVFFLGVGAEIKAEFAEGALSDRRRAGLPIIAAAGGMAVPAAIYLVAVGFRPEFVAGWAIPSATDIAFAVGVVGLLGPRVPAALKAFLLAVAVIDDLGAIVIIALFYTETLHLVPLLVAAGCIGALAGCALIRVVRSRAYVLIGAMLWLALSKSGVSPTLAGVATALFVPMRDPRTGESPLRALEHALKAPIAYGIMPVFAFANAGVSLGGAGGGTLAHPVTLGVALGLLVGKPVGILGATWLAVRAGLAVLPQGARWMQVLGVGFIAGIGFTMSLFVGTLAFDEALQDRVKVGVLAGSLVAALCGATVLVLAARGAALRPAPGPVAR